MNIDIAVTPQGDILEALKVYFPMEALEIMLETKPDTDIREDVDFL
jgi:hypothetical protein